MPALPEIDDPTLGRIVFGNVEPPAGLVKAWPVYGDRPNEPLLPRAQWDDALQAITAGFADAFLPYVHNQRDIGQCNCDATAAAVEGERAIQGLPEVRLSAADLYDRINGGRDQGSLLEDAMAEMLQRGIGTAATCGLVWQRDYRGPAPAAERARYKALEVSLLPTFDHVFSAAVSGRRLISGIMWANSYMQVDADGWLPPADRQAGGHAVMGYKAAGRKLRSGRTQYGIYHQNSWTTGYGVGGRMVLPEEAYRGPVGGWWAVRSVCDEGGVIPIPATEAD